MKQDSNEALKILVKGAGFVYFGMIFSKILTYLYRIVIARIGTSEYGIFSLGLAIVNMAMFIPLLGMDEGIVRYVSYYLGLKEDAKIKGTITTALKISGFLSLIVTTILFFSSEYIAINILREQSLNIILNVLTLSIPFYVISTIYLSVIKAYKRMDYWVFIKSITENISKIGITFILIFKGFGLLAAAIGYTVSLIIACIIAIMIVEFKFVKIFSSKIKSITSTRKLIGYSWPIMFHIIIAQLLGWTDTLMIGYFKNSIEVGIYNAALPTAHVMTIIPAGIFSLSIPIMTDLYAQKQKNEFINVYQTANKWVYYFMVYLLIIFTIFSKEILNILFGSEYVTGSLTLIAGAIGYFIYSNGSGDCILKVIGKTKYIMINTLISTTLNIILNYFLIPRYGMLGAAAASTISLGVWTFLGFIESYYITKIHPFKKGFIKITIIGIITYVLTNLLNKYLIVSVMKLALGLISAALIFIFLIIITKTLDREDKAILNAIKNKITKQILTKILHL